MQSTFKHIRRSVVSSEGTQTYLLYAFGEVLLVMLGILLALQVNNWNEARIEAKKEKNFLRELNNDLKANFGEIVDVANSVGDKTLAIDSILLWFEERDEVTDELREQIMISQTTNIFNNSNTSYEYLKSRGLDFLSNDSLRIRITDMYEKEFRNIHYREELDLRLIKDHLEPYMRQHFTYYDFTPSDAGFRSMCEPVSYENIRTDYRYINLLNSLRGQRLIRLQWLRRTISKLETLIRDIDHELGSS